MAHDVAVAVIIRAGGIQELFPQLRMIQRIVTAHLNDKVAQVAQQAAECYAAEQQRLKLLDDAKIEQHKRNQNHDEVLPAACPEE